MSARGGLVTCQQLKPYQDDIPFDILGQSILHNEFGKPFYVFHCLRK